MKIALIAAALMLTALPILAQTTPPPPAPNDGVHFVEDTAFYQLTGGKQATVFTA